MADFDKISINGTYYNVKDSALTAAVNALTSEVGEVQETVTQQGQTIQQQGQQITQQGQQITEIEAAVKKTPWTTPETYGAKGDGVTDDSAAFTQLFASGLPVMLTAGKTYLLKNPVTANNNVYMLGNGATINVDQALIQSPNVQRLTFNGEYTHIENVNFTANAPTSQWTTDVAAMYAAYVINAKGRVCEVIGCTFKSIWGYAIRVENADTALVSDCVFDKVGGHYKQNNEFDMFGDCVWLGTTDKLQHAEITNCTMTGLVNGTTLSRCAVVLEFSTDHARYLSMSGCTIANYDRTIHAENVQDAYIALAACQITNTNVYAFAIGVGTGTISFRDCYIQTTGNDYNGTRGARNFAKMAFTNCSINYGGPLVWSLASQLPSITFENCYILANLRGSASNSPILDNGNGRITFTNTWFEALTNQLGSLVPSGVNVLVNNSVLASGAQGWSGAVGTLHAVTSDITGVTGYKTASFF